MGMMNEGDVDVECWNGDLVGSEMTRTSSDGLASFSSAGCATMTDDFLDRSLSNVRLRCSFVGGVVETSGSVETLRRMVESRKVVEGSYGDAWE